MNNSVINTNEENGLERKLEVLGAKHQIMWKEKILLENLNKVLYSIMHFIIIM